MHTWRGQLLVYYSMFINYYNMFKLEASESGVHDFWYLKWVILNLSFLSFKNLMHLILAITHSHPLILQSVFMWFTGLFKNINFSNFHTYWNHLKYVDFYPLHYVAFHPSKFQHVYGISHNIPNLPACSCHHY